MRMPQTVAALQAGITVRVASLVRLDFKSGSQFLWQGAGPLRTADGNVWQGVGQLGQISDIDRGVLSSGSSAPTLSLSGVDPRLLEKTLGDPTDYKGLPARIYAQHYDEAWNLLDSPLAVYVGLMDRMLVSDQGATATITLTLVSPLFRVRRPAYAYLSASSQRKLHPEDAGADEIPALVQKVIKWPNYG